MRAIVCNEVAAVRVIARDTKTRLWFNRSKKYLGLFDESKVEARIPIDRVEDIYQHAEHLRRTVTRYLAKAAQGDVDAEGPAPALTV